jgi:hypothetical protein
VTPRFSAQFEIHEYSQVHCPETPEPCRMGRSLRGPCTFYWCATDFELFVRAELSEAPALLATLSFSKSKRDVSTALV